MSDAQDTWQRLATMVVELSDTMHDPHDVQTDTRLVGDSA